jgi:hypothetical protein
MRQLSPFKVRVEIEQLRKVIIRLSMVRAQCARLIDISQKFAYYITRQIQ